MEFEFKYQIKASDLWQARMYYTYGSYLCVVNIICILSSIALLISCWANASAIFRVIMILFFMLFTVFQPLSVYHFSKKMLKESGDLGKEITLKFNEKNIEVEVGGKNEKKTWEQIPMVSIKPTIITVYTDGQHGYILNNQVLGDNRKDLIEMVKRHSKKR